MLGTRLLDVVPKRTLTIVFVIAIVLTATRLLLNTETLGRAQLTVADAAFLVVVGLLAGTLAGLLGIGGGIITVPAMMVGLGLIAVVAKGTSAAVIIPTAIMGTVRNRKTANVDVRTAAIVGIAGVPTAIAGGIVAGHLSDTVSNVSFAVLLLVVAAIQLRTLREPIDPELGDGTGLRVADARRRRRRPPELRTATAITSPLEPSPACWPPDTRSNSSTCMPTASGWR